MIRKVTIVFFMTILMATIDYESQIQPIFNLKCVDCHGNFGGLDMSSYENLMNGGNSGDVVIPFDHFSSELWIRIDSGQMPPGNNDLTPNEVDLIAEWIDEGALQESSLNGDLNGDLILNVLDIILMVGMILDVEYGENADMNLDGIINVLDVVLLLNLILT